ncbi:unnamed protein product [Bursaphelenchus okinawaensis]|uniref:CCHC-type domain-containing protein n=1 Tax=Bursaphelenchus okinawaensis TaxID=465554 RepID=A0A811KX70_9BILA|nr:unnamed protein product [Bursaphelenchus okinawaensis]CAG9113270.1 unnamed protein product [Bursaphelenchus okinawaensis]
MVHSTRDPATRIRHIKETILSLLNSGTETAEKLTNSTFEPTNLSEAVSQSNALKRAVTNITGKIEQSVTLGNEWRSLRSGNDDAEKDYNDFVADNLINEKRKALDVSLQDLKVMLEGVTEHKTRFDREHLLANTPVIPKTSQRLRRQPQKTHPIVTPRMQAVYDAHNPDLENDDEEEDDPGEEEERNRSQGRARNARQNRNVSSGTRSNVGRRKLEPIVFSGDFLEYTSWMTWFLAGFDTPDLSAVEKAQYLLSMVEGEPARILKGIALNDFEDMLDALDQAYDRPDIIQHKLLQKAKNVKVGTGGLRQYILDIKITRRQMQQNGLEWDSPLCIQELVDKLPVEILVELGRVKWALTSTYEVWNMDLLIKALEAVERMMTLPNLNQSKRAVFTTSTSERVEEQNRRTGTSSQQRPNTFVKRYPCLFCNRTDHSSLKCPKTTTLTARKEALQKSGRCFRCLSSDHQSRDCQAKCRECGAAHHRIICKQLPVNVHLTHTEVEEEDEVNDESLALEQLEIELDEKLSRHEVGNPEPTTEGTVFATMANEGCFLTAAEVPYRTSTGEVISIATLLDSDADCSFITEQLAKEIGVKTEKKVLLATH